MVVRDIGGGFGMKVGIQPDEAVAVWAAKVLKRPVRWRAERSEEFAGAMPGRDQLHKCALALDKDGKILALRMEAFANVGAYPSGAGVAIPLFVGPKVTTGTYDIPVVDLRITCVLTTTGHDRRLSRRRPARVPAQPRAAGRHGGAPDRHGSRRAAPAQLRDAGANALHPRRSASSTIRAISTSF